jgi:hypothetical protein
VNERGLERSLYCEVLCYFSIKGIYASEELEYSYFAIECIENCFNEKNVTTSIKKASHLFFVCFYKFIERYTSIGDNK